MVLGITSINNNYYNRPVSFKAKQPEPSINSETPKTYSYEELSEMMKALVITDIVEEEVISPAKETEAIQNTTAATSEKLETLPVDNKGETELHKICQMGDLEKFKKFTQEHPNFDPNQLANGVWSYISTALYYQRGRNLDIVNLLAANKNLDLNITDKNGKNDLHTLCWYGRLDAIKIFVENHPDFNPNQRTDFGDSYIDIATCWRHYDVEDYLTQHIKRQKRQQTFRKLVGKFA